MNCCNAIKHYNDDAQNDGDHKDNIEQLSCPGIRFENNVVETFLPAHFFCIIRKSKELPDKEYSQFIF
jgi:hypothetical protein